MTDAEKLQNLCQAVWNLSIAEWRVSSGVYPPEKAVERYKELIDLATEYGKWPPRVSRDAANRLGEALG